MSAEANPALSKAHADDPVHGGGRSGRLLLPVQSDRHGEVHQRLRRRQGARWPAPRSTTVEAGAGRRAPRSRIGDGLIESPHLAMPRPSARRPAAAFNASQRCADRGRLPGGLQPVGRQDGEPLRHLPAQPATLVGILTILVIYVTMVYGPIAAALVELFPTRIRYTSHVAALPYRQWLVRRAAAGDDFAMIAQTGDIYYGLWYPIVIALATVVIGAVLRAGDQGSRHLRRRYGGEAVATRRPPPPGRAGTAAGRRGQPRRLFTSGFRVHWRLPRAGGLARLPATAQGAKQ